MKQKIKTTFYFLVAVILCSTIFSAMIYFALNDKQTQVDNSVQSVPYYEQTPPDNAGLLFRFENHGSVFLNLDFYEEKVSVIIFDSKITKQTVVDYGYSVFATFDSDYVFLADLIDRFGGLELEDNEKLFRYTGVQVTELLIKNKENAKAVITALLGKIAHNGFSKNDLTFVINNTSTQLSYPEGYPLITYLGQICRTINFVN